MFNEGAYDIVDLPIPSQGMNQFIAPELLPSNYCHVLENIIPLPSGEAQVRFGTRKLFDLASEDPPISPNTNIIESWEFITPDGAKQLVFYAQNYKEDLDIVAANLLINMRTMRIVFTTSPGLNSVYYVPNTPIQVDYTYNSANFTLFSTIDNVEEISSNTINVALRDNFFPGTNAADIQVTRIWYASAIIVVKDGGGGPLRVFDIQGKVACQPRNVYFLQKMIICNGIDDNYVWDGNELIPLTDEIKEVAASNFERLSNVNFRFEYDRRFNPAKYEQADRIVLIINNEKYNFTIEEASFVPGVCNIKITPGTDLPPFTQDDRVELFYFEKPQPFSFIYAAHDRLWALGAGAVGLNFRAPNQSLTVYYTYKPNSITGWFNEGTKNIPAIDMSEKHGIPDNFEAIALVGSHMLFFGRRVTQVWVGDTPGNPLENGNFIWSRNLATGITHGNLIVQVSNGAYFVSKSGLQFASDFNVTRRMGVIAQKEVDPLIKTYVSKAETNDFTYRKCRAFKYLNGNIAGFKIGDQKIIASVFSDTFYSWFLLSGDFQYASSFVSSAGKFILTFKNQVYQYADGEDGTPPLFGDRDGTSIISFEFVPKLVQFFNGGQVRKYANKFYQLILSYASSFVLNPNNKIQINVKGELPTNFSASSDCKFPIKGDLLDGAEPLILQSENLPAPIPYGWRLDCKYEIVTRKLKFFGTSFWVYVNGYTINGPVIFKRIRLFGAISRG